MNRILSSLIFAGIYFFLSILQSCFDDCPDEGPFYIEAVDFIVSNIQLLEIEERGLHGDEFFNYRGITSNDTLSFDSLGITIHAELADAVEVYATGSLLSFAIACEPLVFFDKITQVQITTFNDYNPDFLANQDFTSNFYYSSSFRKIETPLGGNFVENTKPRIDDNLLLRLQQPPSDTTALQLEISITIEGDRVFKKLTQPVIVLP